MASHEKAASRFSWKHALIGRPLETQALAHQTVSNFIGLAVFASDALSSTAYATQEILVILASAGLGASILGLSIPVAITIAVLLVIVTVSYRQTIFAYPNGGGAYIVARDNLGEVAAQIAGAALLTDYILTVSVSISSGVEQIASGIPTLLPFKVELAVAVIVLMTVVNLRGVKESGTIFAVPTYFFLIMMFLTLIIGFVRLLTGNLPTITDVAAIQRIPEQLGLFLILKAFSSGCTALTGVEAISNGITAFKEPRSRNAATTLTWMSGILITLFLGITFLAHQISALPSENETVISQLARSIYGNGSIMYFLTLAGTALILLMAANTSYADFPRLAALHAGDGFLPRQLTFRGSRLVFSWGIVALASCATLLVIVSGASVTALIPLYAIGVFLSFTMSQSGMAVRLWKTSKLKPGETIKGLETTMSYDPHWRLHLSISAFGAICTFIVMLVFAITKFTSGAWFVVLLVPTLVFIFFRIHHHYHSVAVALSLPAKSADLKPRKVQTIILVDGVHRETERIVRFAKSLGNPWRAVHIATRPEKVAEVKQRWKERIGEGELEVIESPYRHLAAPIREYVEKILQENPDTMVHVIMGHLVMDNFWEQVLHQNSALIFNVALGGLDNVVMTAVPYQIHHANGDENGHGNGHGSAPPQSPEPPQAPQQ
jgi:amino acid transporter